MTSDLDWSADPYFEDGEVLSLDGGTTSSGVLWHGVSPRWGHSMHAMCSYHGMYPARLAHYFIETYTDPGDLVVDPFSGRGTTALQALIDGRQSICNDLNPLAFTLSRSKSKVPSWSEVTTVIGRLEAEFQTSMVDISAAPPDIAMLYHPRTLAQICFLRSKLLAKGMLRWTSSEAMIGGAVAGILHGSHRLDGSSAFLSISMPNTFSMSPGYVRRYIEENNLVQPEQDVFECLRHKIARLYADSQVVSRGKTHRLDAIELLKGRSIQSGTTDLLLTSPPYLKVVNYGTANWIRLWWLGVEDVSSHTGAGRKALDALLDHSHSYDAFRVFFTNFLSGVRRALRQNGTAAIVIGDVTTTSGTATLAEDLWSDVGGSSGLILFDVLEDHLPSHTKVSRIWGETKGQATNRDCVLILGRADGEWRGPNTNVTWDETYKDAGPDAAHEWMQQFRRR